MRSVSKVNSTAFALREAIQRLDKEWEYFRQTGLCPKCKAEILGTTRVYDSECYGTKIIQCRSCSKIIQKNGGRHLKKVQVRPVSGTIVDETEDYLFEKIPKLGPRPCSRRKPLVFV